MLFSYYQQLKDLRRIGLFDSGLGGLTVLDKLKKLSSRVSSNGAGSEELPREFIYLGDTARCPYGNRQPAEIVTFMTETVAWLASKNVDGIVVACNTSASVALEIMRRVSPVPIFDLITPTAHHVGQLGGKVGIMATSATVKAQAFSKAIRSVAPALEVIEIACPDLVPIIERGEVFETSTLTVLQKYAEILRKEKVEVLVWGCTHFPFLAAPFKQLVQDRLVIVDPAQILANLIEQSSGATATKPEAGHKYSVYVTGNPFEFSRTAGICLGYSLDTINGITLNELANPQIGAGLVSEKPETSESISIVSAV